MADKKQPARKPADKKTVEKKQTEKKDKAGTIHVTLLSEQGQKRNRSVALSKMLMLGSDKAIVIGDLRCCSLIFSKHLCQSKYFCPQYR